MNMPVKFNVIAIGALILFTLDAHAAINNSDVLDNVLDRYQAAAGGWAAVIIANATWLFWTLVLISMVWTFGIMALRRADIAEFFAELFRFTVFTGFFWWLLINGPAFAGSIIASLRTLGGNATGLGSNLSPSGVVDVGFAIFDRVVDQSSIMSPVNSAVGLIIAAIILVVLALVGVNMLLLLVAGWVLAFGGVFFLGFGGSRWTSDMAINYYKTVLSVAAQLFVMVLIVGIGKTFLDDYYGRMSVGISIKEMGVMLIVAVILLMLVNKLPSLVAGIITGAHAGMGGVGQAGAGTALGAFGMATAAAATGGAMVAAGAANAAGGAQALMSAFSKASENVSSGSDVLTSMWGGGPSSSKPESSGSGATVTPFAQAAGFNNPIGAGTSGESMSSLNKSEGDGNAKEKSSESKAQAKGGDQTGNSDKMSSQKNDGTNKGGVLATATKGGKIMADAGASLAKGMTEVAKSKSQDLKDATAGRTANTFGGRLAAEIRSPGAKSQERQDNQDIAAANAIKSQQTRSEEADQARQFLREQQNPFTGNSLSGEIDTQSDPDAEIAAFRDKDQRKS